MDVLPGASFGQHKHDHACADELLSCAGELRRRFVHCRLGAQCCRHCLLGVRGDNFPSPWFVPRSSVWASKLAEFVRVLSDLSSLPVGHFGNDVGLIEENLAPFYDCVYFHHCRLIRLAKADVSVMFFQPLGF